MPEGLGSEVLATRVAFLELKEERRLVQEGYELLDEKRMLLATEIMRQLREHGELQAATQAAADQARKTLAAALRVHGLDELKVEPRCDLDSSRLHRDVRSFLGTRLVDVELDLAEEPLRASPVRPTPELRACASAFRLLLQAQAATAACAGNLRRLTVEYRRTERRARALEKVLMPEIDESLRFIEEQLDGLDQEEALRVRMAGSGRG
jgi:V/A-type H+-transporting ATPase subunit D